MLGLESGRRGSWLGSSDDRRGRAGLERRTDNGVPSTALLITGAVVIGLGFLAWSYLGADLKRYIKIHKM